MAQNNLPLSLMIISPHVCPSTEPQPKNIGELTIYVQMITYPQQTKAKQNRWKVQHDSFLPRYLFITKLIAKLYFQYNPWSLEPPLGEQSFNQRETTLDT